MFNVDDLANQPLADAYGVVMGSSHTGEYTILPFEKIRANKVFQSP
jgi:hypothetical protein